MSNLKAMEGQWYADRSTRDRFYVIRVDQGEGLIDVRDDHGDIDEFDMDEWDSMDLVLISAPRHWARRVAKAGGDDEQDDRHTGPTRSASP